MRRIAVFFAILTVIALVQAVIGTTLPNPWHHINFAIITISTILFFDNPRLALCAACSLGVFHDFLSAAPFGLWLIIYMGVWALQWWLMTFVFVHFHFYSVIAVSVIIWSWYIIGSTILWWFIDWWQTNPTGIDLTATALAAPWQVILNTAILYGAFVLGTRWRERWEPFYLNTYGTSV